MISLTHNIQNQQLHRDRKLAEEMGRERREMVTINGLGGLLGGDGNVPELDNSDGYTTL
jgi:hypothetical protein